MMGVGATLREYDNQYKAVRDEHGIWRILNRWHSDLEGFGPEDDVPDDHPAIKLLSEGEFLSVMHEVKVLGMLQKFEEDGDFTVSSEAYDKLVEEKKELMEKLNNEHYTSVVKEEHEGVNSEAFQLANRKLDLIEKMNLDKDDSDLLNSIIGVGGNASV